MRNGPALILALMMMFSLSACGNNSHQNTPSTMPGTGQPSEPNAEQTPIPGENTELGKDPENERENGDMPEPDAGSDILIVYFSRAGNSYGTEDVDAVTSASLAIPGNTAVIANMVEEAIGGDLFQIITVDPYPKDYRETTDVARVELDEDARPELSTHVENMDAYDIVVLGYPNWWGTVPMAVYTFLEEYDFSGKTIVPYCTHQGSGLGRSATDIKTLCPDSTILDGLAVSGSRVSNAQSDVNKWLSDLGLVE